MLEGGGRGSNFLTVRLVQQWNQLLRGSGKQFFKASVPAGLDNRKSRVLKLRIPKINKYLVPIA